MNDQAAVDADDPFEQQLWRFILITYAAGHTVEGEWHLMDTDPMVPDLVVAIERLESELVVPDSQDRAGVLVGASAGFKERLQTFLLTRFSEGVDVEGTWTLRYRRHGIPDWEVTIASSVDEVVVTGDERRFRSR